MAGVSLGPVGKWWSTRSGFARALLAAVALGALIRIVLLVFDDRVLGPDAFFYHGAALRWEGGPDYTSAAGAATAAVPPGWLTVVGLFSWLGARSVLAHQVLAVVAGLGVVVVAGLVARRYFGDRIGAWAAFGAAVYPGFWLADVQALPQSANLLLVGGLFLALDRLRQRPTLTQGAVIGGICGALALVRPEQGFLLLVLVVVPMSRWLVDLTRRERRLVTVVACGVALAVVSPWVVYNLTRFDKPVVVSTETSMRLLAGNCSPTSFEGERIGYSDAFTCSYTLISQNLRADESEIADLARGEAFSNISDNLDVLPLTLLARVGRLLAVFRPGQNVEWSALALGSGEAPVWAWFAAFWLLLPAAVAGAVRARRHGWPFAVLLAPAAVALAVALLTYGDPVQRGPADLGLLVLAAAGLESIWSRRGRLVSSLFEGTAPTGGPPLRVTEGLPEEPGDAATVGAEPEAAPAEPHAEPAPAEKQADTPAEEAPAEAQPEEPWGEPESARRKQKKPKRPKRLPRVVLPPKP